MILNKPNHRQKIHFNNTNATHNCTTCIQHNICQPRVKHQYVQQCIFYYIQQCVIYELPMWKTSIYNFTRRVWPSKSVRLRGYGIRECVLLMYLWCFWTIIVIMYTVDHVYTYPVWSQCEADIYLILGGVSPMDISY